MYSDAITCLYTDTILEDLNIKHSTREPQGNYYTGKPFETHTDNELIYKLNRNQTQLLQKQSAQAH